MSAEIHVYLSLLLTWHYIFLLEKLMVSLGFYVQCLRLQYGTMNIINQKNMRENVGYFYTTKNQFYKIPQDGV